MTASNVEVMNRAIFLIYDYIKHQLNSPDFANEFKKFLQATHEKEIIAFKGLTSLTDMITEHYRHDLENSNNADATTAENAETTAENAASTAENAAEALDEQADKKEQKKARKKKKKKEKSKPIEAAPTEEEPAEAETEAETEAEAKAKAETEAEAKAETETEPEVQKKKKKKKKKRVKTVEEQIGETMENGEEKDETKEKEEEEEVTKEEETVETNGADLSSSKPSKKRKQRESNGVDADTQEVTDAKKKRHGEPYRRVREEEVENKHFKDNSFVAKPNARNSWGFKANQDLLPTQGRSFRHEKTKKKRGSYKGGAIDTAVTSMKFDSDSE